MDKKIKHFIYDNKSQIHHRLVDQIGQLIPNTEDKLEELEK